MSFEVKPYHHDLKDAWNTFVASAKNATFLFNRNYMDYHADRFRDCSLMVYKNSFLVAILPANSADGRVVSHQGLTYGGLVLHAETKLIDAVQIFKSVLQFFHDAGYHELIYKKLPHFYHRSPAFEDDYFLFLAGAACFRVDTAFVLQRKDAGAYQKRRQRAIQKAKSFSIRIIEQPDLTFFWTHLLTPNLQTRFGINPVHSLEEIQLLQSRFPGQIRYFAAVMDDEEIAGTLLFITDTTVHAQYIAAGDEGRKTGALDLLFHELITTLRLELPYFSFGIVNEEEGRKMNVGLMEWKEGFGTAAFPHYFFRVETAGYSKLDSLST